MKLFPSFIPTSVLVGLFLFGCSTPERRKGFGTGSAYTPPAPAVSPRNQELEEKALGQDAQYRQMQELFRKGQHEQVVEAARNYEKTRKTSPFLSYTRNLSGLSLLAQRKVLPAIAQFQRALDYNQSEFIRPYLQYNLAAALAEADQIEDSLETLKEVRSERLNPETRAKYFSLLAKNLLHKEKWVDSAKATLESSALLGPQGGTKPALVEQLDRALAQIQKQDDLAALLRGHENSPLAEKVRSRLQTGLNLNAPAASSSGDSRVIGALLPLSGKFSEYGSRVLRAITLGLRLFEGTGTDFTLQIEDSGDTPEQAIRALNRLANQKQVSMVIGPLRSPGIDQITTRAEMLGVPLITLAQSTGTKGDYVFSAGLTPALQAREIAKHAIEKLGLKRFAIVHPRDRFGEQYSQSYWDAVEELGGEVVGIESYSPGETDFRAVVDRLVGTGYPESRQAELRELAKKREELQITKKTRKTAELFDLKPIVEFDAVFIPDEPKVVSMLLPTFAYRDVDQVKFLGIATWNNPELIQRAQQNAEGATFVDALHMDSSNPVTQRFIVDYSREVNEYPSSIEAMAFDAALIAEKVLAPLPRGKVSRSQVKTELQGIQNLKGATGQIAYKDGQFARNLTLLTIRDGKIIEVR